MAARRTLQKSIGLTQSLKNPKPPASSPGFEWPWRGTPQLQKAFGSSVRQLCAANGIDYRDLARELFGTKQDSKGYMAIRNANVVKAWASGHKSFPSHNSAAYVAHFFRVPMQRLITPEGPDVPLVERRPKRKGNGAHKPVPQPAAPAEELRPARRVHHRTVHAPIERLPLPADAPPVGLTLETFKGDPRFMQVKIEGTVQVEIALSLMALLHPEPESPAHF